MQGGDDGADWRTLVDDGPLVSLRVGDQAIDARTLTYPASRFRYLRMHVYPDKAGDNKVNPLRVRVWRAVEKQGEDYTVPVEIGPREPVPTPGGPGSAWFLSVRDARGADLEAYWERLSFDVANEEFSRSYSVEEADPGWTPRPLSAGGSRWVRAPGIGAADGDAFGGQFPAAAVDCDGQPRSAVAADGRPFDDGGAAAGVHAARRLGAAFEAVFRQPGRGGGTLQRLRRRAGRRAGPAADARPPGGL